MSAPFASRLRTRRTRACPRARIRQRRRHQPVARPAQQQFARAHSEPPALCARQFAQRRHAAFKRRPLSRRARQFRAQHPPAVAGMSERRVQRIELLRRAHILASRLVIGVRRAQRGAALPHLRRQRTPPRCRLSARIQSRRRALVKVYLHAQLSQFFHAAPERQYRLAQRRHWSPVGLIGRQQRALRAQQSAQLCERAQLSHQLIPGDAAVGSQMPAQQRRPAPHSSALSSPARDACSTASLS